VKLHEICVIAKCVYWAHLVQNAFASVVPRTFLASGWRRTLLPASTQPSSQELHSRCRFSPRFSTFRASVQVPCRAE